MKKTVILTKILYNKKLEICGKKHPKTNTKTNNFGIFSQKLSKMNIFKLWEKWVACLSGKAVYSM